jgi:hypothetical protein
MVNGTKEMYIDTSYLGALEVMYSCRDTKKIAPSLLSSLLAHSSLPGLPLLLQFQFGLSVILRGIDSVVRVVDKVWPWENVRERCRVSRVPVCNTLHVLGHLRGSVERLALLDLVDHLPHVHLYLAAVLTGSVEAHCHTPSATPPLFSVTWKYLTYWKTSSRHTRNNR